MIPFAAYTAAETPDVFQWARQLQKLFFSVRDIDSHLTHSCLDSFESAPQTETRSAETFLYSTFV